MLRLTGGSWERRLRPGDEVTFGRGGAGVEITLGDDPGLHRHCGTVRVRAGKWELHNTGRWLAIRVIGLDRPGLDTVLPGQGLSVPWSSCRVDIVVGSRSHGFDAAWTTSGAVRSAVPVDAVGADATAAPVRIDRDSGYFRALVALCEPKLRDPSSDVVATDAQIAWRLNQLATEPRRLSAKTVERRLDHCRTRFGFKATDEWGVPIAPDRRDLRRQLADAALLSGIVSALDLAVLDGAVATA